MIILYVCAGIVVVIAIWLVFSYNRFVTLRNQVKNAWAQIDVQLKRRHDLIPNLVETVKGYAQHERTTLDNVTRARQTAMQAKSIGDISQAEQGLTTAMRQLFAVIEQYPDLKANQNFLALQEEVASTENRIAFARQFYNDQVMQFNTLIQSVPSNLIARAFAFAPAQFFELETTAERQAPKTTF